MIRLIKRWFLGLFKKTPTTSECTDCVVVPTVLESIGAPGFYGAEIVDATHDEKAVVLKAIDALNVIRDSSFFKDAVMAAKFTETDGKSNQEIFDDFTKKTFNVSVKIFNGTWMQNHRFHTVALDNSSDDFVYLNRYYFGSVADTADSIMHESAHGTGYHHYGDKSTSVPYVMGQIAYDICMKLGLN